MIDKQLQALNDDELFEYVTRESIGTPFASAMVSHGDVDAEETVGFTSADDLRALGIRIYNRISREVHNLVCGNDPGDRAELSSLRNTAGLNEAAICALLVTVLTSVFSLPVAAASGLSILLYRRVFTPAGKEVCAFWRENLQ